MSRQLVLAVLAVNVLVLLTLATVSGRWTKDRDLANQWGETGIWSQCTCVDSIDNNCASDAKYLRVVQGFSLIAALCEWIAVFVLTREFFSAGNLTLLRVALVLFVTALVANLITWAAFGAYYRKEGLCSAGQKSYHNRGVSLSWAYGVRLGEFGLLVVLVIFMALAKKRDPGVPPTGVYFVSILLAVLTLMLTVLTTSGRGWMRKVNTGVFEQIKEFGLWDNCLCQQQANNKCIDARRLITVVEVFSVVSIVFTFVLIKYLYATSQCKASTAFARIFAALGLVANLIVVIVFTQYVKETFAGCGPALWDSQQFHWAYGVACAGLILQAFVFLGTLAPSHEDAKTTEPSH